MGQVGLEVFVHLNSFTPIQNYAQALETQSSSRTPPSHRIEESVGNEFFTASKSGSDLTVRCFFNGCHVLIEIEGHADVPQMVGKGFGNLGIHKVEELRPLVDESHFDIQKGQDAGVLCTDDSRSHYQQIPGKF